MPKQVRSVAALFLVSAVATWVMWLATRSLPPRLADRCGDRGRPIDSAGIAVVGVIASDSLVLRPVPMHSDATCPLQLRRLGIRIENVLRGSVAAGKIEVFYFTWAGGFDGNQPLGFWRIGDRRIFLLRRDSGVLRTACDGADNCTWGVYSGAHPAYRPDPGRPVGYAIADILLTRGEGRIRESKFAGAIEWEAPAPFDYLIDRLGRLAVTETSGVRTAACLVLWTYAQDRAAPDTERMTAGNWMREAGCRCTQTPDWKLDCGSEARINRDPPW